MKLKVFDRILLAVLLIVGILVAFVLFGVAARLIPLSAVQAFAATLYDGAENALIVAGVGLLLLLVCGKLVFAGRGGKREPEAPATATMAQTEIGGTYISLAAIDAMVKKYCAGVQRIRESHNTIRATEEGVAIGIRLSVLADTDVVSLTRELQQGLKANIESMTGISVQEIGVLVESTVEQPAARVE